MSAIFSSGWKILLYWCFRYHIKINPVSNTCCFQSLTFCIYTVYFICNSAGWYWHSVSL
jgi:hypothetical protein